MTNTTPLELDRTEFEATEDKGRLARAWGFGESADDYADPYVQARWVGWQRARAALAAKGQQEPVAWISVKDRLPEPWDGKRFSKSVLIVDMDSSYPHVRMSELNFDDEGSTVWSGADPTHWRPAPALPGSLAAPVAQQSEAQAWTGEQIADACVKAGLGILECHGLLKTLKGQQSEAGAPKDHEIREAINQLRDVAVQFHATQQLRERIAGIVLPLVAGRESAAPAAPVREGDREQDANLATARDAVRRVMADLSILHEGKPEEMAATIALTATLVSGDLELAANSIDAAMQKGASNG